MAPREIFGGASLGAVIAQEPSDPKSTPSAVVFDFGGVFTPSPFDAMVASLTELDVDPTEGLRMVFGDYATDGDHPWHRLERGETEFMAARAEIMETSQVELGVELDVIALLGAFGESTVIRDEVVQLARSLNSADKVVGLLTNNLAEFSSSWKKMLQVDELFAEIVDSSSVGMRKPDHKIYELTQERLGIGDPASVLFLDDAEGNITAAADFGWQTILVTNDYKAAIAETEMRTGLGG